MHQGLFALVSMIVFLGILLAGYVWLYKRVLLSGPKPYFSFSRIPGPPFASSCD